MGNAQRIPFAEAARKPMFWFLLAFTGSRAGIVIWMFAADVPHNGWKWILLAYTTEMLDGRLTERFGVRTRIGKAVDRASTLAMTGAAIALILNTTYMLTFASIIAVSLFVLIACGSAFFLLEARSAKGYEAKHDAVIWKKRLVVSYEILAVPCVVIVVCMPSLGRAFDTHLEWHHELVALAVGLVLINVVNLFLRSEKFGRLFPVSRRSEATEQPLP